MMLLEIDSLSPPRSPRASSVVHTSMHTPVSSPSPPMITLGASPEISEKVITDMDPGELRRLYLAAMMSLKAEKQQRIRCLILVGDFQ